MSEITITREKFREVLADAAKHWKDIPSADGEKNSFAEFMMFLQNMAFGALVEKKLFGEEDEKNEEDN